MRILRVTLVGTVIPALLGGLGGAVLAQMDGDAEAVYTTRVSMGSVTETSPVPVFNDDPLVSYRDGQLVWTEEWSDPRASGKVTATFHYDVDPKTGQGITWGTNLVENDGGTWEGPCRGIVYEPPDVDAGTSVGVLGGPGEFFTVNCWLTGAGDYAGYTLFSQEDAVGDGGPSRVMHGLIFKGQPPVPEAPSE